MVGGAVGGMVFLVLLIMVVVFSLMKKVGGRKEAV